MEQENRFWNEDALAKLEATSTSDPLELMLREEQEQMEDDMEYMEIGS